VQRVNLLSEHIKFSDSLVEANRQIWDAMAAHPWVKGLAEGTLPEEALIAWDQQYRLYCMQEHRALLIMRALNPAAELGTQLDKTMERLEFKLEDDTICEPRELADTLHSLYAPLIEEVWPVCLGYGSFVITCARDGLLEGLAAVYTCMSHVWYRPYVGSSFA
jgi:thiaminase/transcriptional activator TenA